MIGTAANKDVAPAVLIVADNDGTSTAITLSVSPATLGEGDGATSFTVTATLEGASTLPWHR